jgi:hypothetical protein
MSNAVLIAGLAGGQNDNCYGYVYFSKTINPRSPYEIHHVVSAAADFIRR